MPEPPHDLPLEDFLPLVERARKGDAEALQRLFEHCRAPVLARIRWMMGEEARHFAESSDFLQSTFAAALTALPRVEVRGSDSLLRWLTTIARNKIRSGLRRRREEALSTLSSALSGEPRGVEGQHAEWSVDSAMTLMDAMSKLADDERQLIEWRDLEGDSFAQIGARLGCSERHALRLHAQALVRLGRSFRGKS